MEIPNFQKGVFTMKRTYSIIALLLTLIFTLSACGSNSSIGTADQGVVNDTEYNNYSFWMEENQIRILLQMDVHIEEIPDELATSVKNTPVDLTKRQMATIEKLKAGIEDYFSEVYGLDVSEKLSQQEVRGYEPEDEASQAVQETLGYVDVNDPNVLNLHTSILTGDQKDLFETVYVHETLHQIGFRAPNLILID